MNLQVEEQAIAAILAYESKHDRTAHEDKGQGYDVCSQGPTGERHIEVKARSKSLLSSKVRLSESQTRRLLNDPAFWLYFVHSVESGAPVVIPIPRRELLERRVTLRISASVAFHKEDWAELITRTTEEEAC